MMSPNLLVVFLLMVTQSEALGNFGQIQQPMPGIIVPNLEGIWFNTYRKPPSSWYGSVDFENANALFTFDGKNTILQRVTWGFRDGFCSNMLEQMTLTPTPGVFLLKDSIGDMVSGRLVALGTDYKHFVVYWGCTKFSVFGDKCDDPFIAVKTRMPQPSMETILKVNSVLMQRFGITVNELGRVVHTGACYMHGDKKNGTPKEPTGDSSSCMQKENIYV